MKLGWLLILLRTGLIKGTAVKLSGRDKENILRALEDDEIRITDKRGKVLLSIDAPDLVQKHREKILAIIEDKQITWKEIGEVLDDII